MKYVPLTLHLHSYVLAHSSSLGPVADRLIVETPTRTGRPTMQVPPEEALFLRFLVASLRAERVLEIGTFTGLSALAMASALPPGGTVVCLDRSEEWTSIARDFWAEAGLSDRIELRLGPAHESLAAMGPEEAFDFVFIDADKAGYVDYYEASLPRLREGGLIAVDNTLWSGRVIDPSDHTADTEAMRRFNDRVASDPRVEVLLLPVADGITLIRRAA